MFRDKNDEEDEIESASFSANSSFKRDKRANFDIKTLKFDGLLTIVSPDDQKMSDTIDSM